MAANATLGLGLHIPTKKAEMPYLEQLPMGECATAALCARTRSSVPCSGRALREDSFLSAKSQGELPKSLSRGTRVLRMASACYYLGPDPIQRRGPHAGVDAMAHSNQRSSKRIGEAGRVCCGAFSFKAFKIRPRAFKELHTPIIFIPRETRLQSGFPLFALFLH